MLRIAILIGSTRPGRKAEAVARWVYDIAAKRSDTSFEIVDIADFDLPLLDEPMPPVFHQYDKAAGFVGYGGTGGIRAVEQLRLVMGEIKVAPVRSQVGLSLFADFENFTTFKPRPEQRKAVDAMLDDLVAWGGALQALRAPVNDGGGAI